MSTEREGHDIYTGAGGGYYGGCGIYGVGRGGGAAMVGGGIYNDAYLGTVEGNA